MDIEELDIDWNYVVERLDRIIDLSEESLARLLSDDLLEPGVFRDYVAFRWVRSQDHGYLEEVLHPTLTDHDELFGLGDLLDRLRQNTEQFVRSYPANNVLLWGAHGCGKASAVKGLLKLYASEGLRLIKVQPENLSQLPLITDLLREHPYRFLLWCEHLSLTGQPYHYEGLKSILDGDVAEPAGNVLFYATSTGSPFATEKSEHGSQGQPPPLSHCFGLRLEFPAMSRAAWMELVRHLARQRTLDLSDKELHREAVQWLEERGYYSGRVARQFIDDLSGRLGLAGKIGPLRP